MQGNKHSRPCLTSDGQRRPRIRTRIGPLHPLTDHHAVAAAKGSGPMLGGDQLLPGGDELLFNAEAGLLY